MGFAFESCPSLVCEQTVSEHPNSIGGGVRTWPGSAYESPSYINNIDLRHTNILVYYMIKSLTSEVQRWSAWYKLAAFSWVTFFGIKNSTEIKNS